MYATGDNWEPSKYTNFNKHTALNSLKDNYVNPMHPLAFMGVSNIYKYYNGVLSKKVIKSFLASTEVYSMIKQEKRNPKKRWTPIVSFHYLDLVQMDLIEISTLSAANLNMNYILCVIDCFSRLVQAVIQMRIL